jgi:hypothetical protein
MRGLLIVWSALAVSQLAGATAASCEDPRRRDPDHLVPVDPHPTGIHGKYQNLWQELLKVSEFEADDPEVLFGPGTKIVAMVHRPSFNPEECIFLRERGGARPPRVRPDPHARQSEHLFLHAGERPHRRRRG